MKKILLFTGFLCLGLTLFAQIKKTTSDPINRSSGGTGEVLFFDDFSSGDTHPDARFWGPDAKDIYVNDHFSGGAQLSVGVATFDSFDEHGERYDEDATEGDRLISLPLDLSGYGIMDQLELNFYLQILGLGLSYNKNTDFFVDFLSASGEWVEQFSTKGAYVPSCLSEPFDFHSLPLSPAFLFNGFQFRFRYDTPGYLLFPNFHLDYVKLQANITPSVVNEDVAFTTKPSHLLRRYRSMPWRHFYDEENDDLFPGELNSRVQVGLFNHFDISKNVVSPVINVKDGNTTLHTCPLLDGIQSTIPAHSRVDYDNPLICQDALRLAIIDQYRNSAQPTNLVMEYRFDVSGEPNSPAMLAEITSANNQTQQATYFEDYFAYDDGTAEYGRSISRYPYGYAFQANTDDQISAIMIHFFNTGLAESLDGRVSLMAWLDNMDDTPERKIYSVAPVFFDPYSGFALCVSMSPGFHAHEGTDFNARIEETCYFRGFTGDPPASAADRQTEAEEKDLPSITPTNIQLQAFPNPFNSQLTVDFSLLEAGPIDLNIYNLQGAVVASLIQSTDYSAGLHQLNVHQGDLAAGIYFLGLRSKGQMTFQKLVKIATKF